jgi:serine/threonine-protein kinase HipA
MRRISAYWWNHNKRVRIGELAQARGTPIYFEWDSDFLKSEIELSPLRFKKQPGLIECPAQPFDGLPGLFADSVPDGWGRILFRRGLERQGLDFEEISPLDMLQYIADRGMGALSFEPSLQVGESWADGKVDLEELQQGVEPILAGTPSVVLEEFLSGGASPNGMRPKIIAKIKNGIFYVGDEKLKADEWIIKFRAPEDSSEIGKVEYIYSLLAQEAGLRVQETKLFKTNKGYFFGAKRFDRDDLNRIHMHTLSGILQTSPANFAVGYEHFAKVAGAITKDLREVEEVFKLAVFNVLACNQDDHSRNVSFLMDSSGSWKVAPAYDLTFHQTRYNEHKMSLYGKGNPSEEELRNFGKEIGISQKNIKEVVESVKSALNRFSIHAKKYDLSKKELSRIKKALQI